jgi:hypothetical protein
MRILWSTNVNTCNRRYSETSQKGCWLGPKGMRVVRASPTRLDADNNPAGGQGGPKVFVVKYAERGNPVSSPGAILASATVRHAVGDAELRGWKKRMPFCNGADTGFKVTRPERELTSIWCPAVKPPEEPRQEGKQMTPSKERWCTFHLRVRGCRVLSQSERAIRTLAGNHTSLVAFGRLEPYDGKLSRTVLRGAGAG